VFKTGQSAIMGKVDICRMFLKSFYDLEHEYRQVAALIARSVGVKETARLVQRRMAIVSEAREIANKMNVPNRIGIQVRRS
jgi:hypothetical protein